MTAFLLPAALRLRRRRFRAARYGCSGRLVVAGKHDDAHARLRRAARTSRIDLYGVGDRDERRQRPIDRDEDRRSRLSAEFFGLHSSGAMSTPWSDRNRRIASTTDRPSTCRGRHDRRANRSRDRGHVTMFAPRRPDDRKRQRVLACPLDTGREPEQSLLSNPGAVTISITAGLPSVSVPVLSTTSVSILSIRSSASAFLIRTPACAPRPTPTMIDMGVASPSAQGQAMIRTATASTSA